MRRLSHVWSRRSGNPVAPGARRAALRPEAAGDRAVAGQDDGRVQEGDEGDRGRGERERPAAGGDRAGAGEGPAAGDPVVGPEVRGRPDLAVGRPAQGVNLDARPGVAYLVMTRPVV